MDSKFRRTRTFKLLFVLVLSLSGLIFSGQVAARGLAPSNGEDFIRGTWEGTIVFPGREFEINLYFSEFGPDPDDPDNPTIGVSSGFISFSNFGQQKRAKALMVPMQARYIDLGGGEFDMTVVSPLVITPPQGNPHTITLTGKIQTFGSKAGDDIFNGLWHVGNTSGSWSAGHLDRRKISAPEVRLLYGLYFHVDVYAALNGPSGNSQALPYTLFEVDTNIVFANLLVEMPDGESVIIPPPTDIFSPDVHLSDVFRYIGGIDGLPKSGTYNFTALDILGNPIAGLTSTVVYVGGNEPDLPPT